MANYNGIGKDSKGRIAYVTQSYSKKIFTSLLFILHRALLNAICH